LNPFYSALFWTFIIGPDTSTELLSLVMGTAPARDPFSTTERLVETYKDLRGIAHARLYELEQIPGIGQAKAIQLQSAIEIGHRIHLQQATHRTPIRTPADAAHILIPRLGLLEQEEVHVVSLDTRNRIVKEEMVYRGSLNSASVRVGEIFRSAIRDNAAAIILAHNHPSGEASPSSDDIAMTREVIKGGKILEIGVLDHLIIAGTLYTSLKDRGLGFD
jgi:DNA repair protein RadC